MIYWNSAPGTAGGQPPLLPAIWPGGAPNSLLHAGLHFLPVVLAACLPTASERLAWKPACSLALLKATNPEPALAWGMRRCVEGGSKLVSFAGP